MEIWLLLLLAAVGAFWFAGMQAREQAVRIARRTCREHGVQLLDETVMLHRLRPARDTTGRVRWHRFYQFEFSIDSAQRRSGWLELLGGRLRGVHLDLDDYTLHEGAPLHDGEIKR